MIKFEKNKIEKYQYTFKCTEKQFQPGKNKDSKRC